MEPVNEGLRMDWTRAEAQHFYDHGPRFAQSMCATCGHPCGYHFAEDGLHGCVATTGPAANSVVQARVAGEDGGCLCPGYVGGQLPWNLVKHLDPLVDDEEDEPCGGCSHPLSVHSENVGCWNCPCNIDFLPDTWPNSLNT